MVSIEFCTQNAAFTDYPYPQYVVSRVIESVAESISKGKTDGPIYDSNGNKIGKFFYEQEYEE